MHREATNRYIYRGATTEGFSDPEIDTSPSTTKQEYVPVVSTDTDRLKIRIYYVSTKGCKKGTSCDWEHRVPADWPEARSTKDYLTTLGLHWSADFRDVYQIHMPMPPAVSDSPALATPSEQATHQRKGGKSALKEVGK